MKPNVWNPDFLEWLEQADEPESNTEAEWAGEWKVVSFAEDRHLVLRGWEDPTQDHPLGIFQDRSVALLCAAVLPLEARPTLFIVSRPDPPRGGRAVLVRDTYQPGGGIDAEPVGEVRELSEHQLFALHLAACLARSPCSLALLLEAAGPTAIRLVGEILHRRLVR
jgi:hypothetical protein